MSNTATKRFEDKVMPEPMSGCWLWTGAMMGSGYGNFRANGRNHLAHRFSYIANRGPIPDKLTIDHRCHTKLCVNPDHMEVVTLAENGRRSNGDKTHCKYGHPLSGANLYVRPDRTGRDCRECRCRIDRERQKRSRA